MLLFVEVFNDTTFYAGGNSAISAKWKKEFLPEHCVMSVEIFDPAANSWTTGPDLANALCGAGLKNSCYQYRNSSSSSVVVDACCLQLNCCS
jgi:hypothetical protein